MFSEKLLALQGHVIDVAASATVAEAEELAAFLAHMGDCIRSESYSKRRQETHVKALQKMALGARAKADKIVQAAQFRDSLDSWEGE
jgi:hypothetical protein